MNNSVILLYPLPRPKKWTKKQRFQKWDRWPFQNEKRVSISPASAGLAMIRRQTGPSGLSEARYKLVGDEQDGPAA